MAPVRPLTINCPLMPSLSMRSASPGGRCNRIPEHPLFAAGGIKLSWIFSGGLLRGKYKIKGILGFVFDGFRRSYSCHLLQENEFKLAAFLKKFL
ncbi:hypothetical protein TNIN_470071 [Trichonephila inaurata madagascariensis]|uniref:Uncharacterized protein n=1 Tax=Trichonephila inaurata madagascariensis TaxID=2747483 RepID=A0A8X7CB39_9ARAC|nr:hypothetical protein TNIN_470071 [Trichonephila inaurata madagascariensis]